MAKARKRDARTNKVITFRKGDTFRICGAEIKFTNGNGKVVAEVRAPVHVRYSFRSRLTNHGNPP